MDLKDLRLKIDEVDNQMIALFQQRLDICRDIAEVKLQAGRPVQDLERERQKIEALREKAVNDFNEEGVVELFNQVMSISRKLQYQIMAERGTVGAIPFEMLPTIPKKKARVVYQGIEGAYSQAAMFQFFGEDVRNYNVKTWDDAMKAVCGGMADYAVLPLENSIAGQVGDVYDLLMHYDNYIVGETYLKVQHVLMGLPGTKEDEIKRIYSHPQGLMQCSEYLNTHSGVERFSTDNTATSARKVVEEQDTTYAAIASEQAAKNYGLEILNRDVMDNPENYTRFIIVSSKKIYSEEAKKVSICFECSHEVGSLYRLMSHFIYNNLNMTKIESRPVPGKAWEYRFFVDIDGNLSSAEVKNALRGILEEAIYFKILGNY
ncbi:MAG: prephenate dehydratase [Lachnospiraceae bacterium]|nr:prephenate dehydratase [Lachnospiraceae bacterium]